MPTFRTVSVSFRSPSPQLHPICTNGLRTFRTLYTHPHLHTETQAHSAIAETEASQTHRTGAGRLQDGKPAATRLINEYPARGAPGTLLPPDLDARRRSSSSRRGRSTPTQNTDPQPGGLGL